MTRINLVKPEDLADQHLFAEWREIKIIPTKVRKLQETQDPVWISKRSKDLEYTHGTGHVVFFYNKLGFLYERYITLDQELHKRNYNIAVFNPGDLFIDGIKWHAQSVHWKPKKNDIQKNIERISERLHQRPNWYRHYGEIKEPQFFIDRYNHQLVVDAIVS